MRNKLRSIALAGGFATTAIPVEAIVVDQGAVARTMILLFVAFAVILFLIVLGLVAAVSMRPRRRANLRVALIFFPAASAAAVLVIVVLAQALNFATLERAMLSGAIFLVVCALVLVVRAFVVSRRT